MHCRFFRTFFATVPHTTI